LSSAVTEAKINSVHQCDIGVVFVVYEV